MASKEGLTPLDTGSPVLYRPGLIACRVRDDSCTDQPNVINRPEAGLIDTLMTILGCRRQQSDFRAPYHD